MTLQALIICMCAVWLCQATVAQLKEAPCAAHELYKWDVQLWDYWQGGYFGEEPLDAQLDATLGEANILDTQSVMLLEKVWGPRD